MSGNVVQVSDYECVEQDEQDVGKRLTYEEVRELVNAEKAREEKRARLEETSGKQLDDDPWTNHVLPVVNVLTRHHRGYVIKLILNDEIISFCDCPDQPKAGDVLGDLVKMGFSVSHCSQSAYHHGGQPWEITTWTLVKEK